MRPEGAGRGARREFADAARVGGGRRGRAGPVRARAAGRRARPVTGGGAAARAPPRTSRAPLRPRPPPRPGGRRGGRIGRWLSTLRKRVFVLAEESAKVQHVAGTRKRNGNDKRTWLSW
ncbi:hypothetical protein GCM10010305_24520 [Streptomyces termitum]|uniref:Uncharacterized protein n=1 Tax=Streptomyces termitum TaxID=67368 RepID=A0A918SZ08_9ACTN|nr:hypothetical protein GCM10010305_24520 [Streptomyces termitum]